MPEHVGELSSLVGIKLQQPFPDSYYHAGRVCVQVVSLALESATVFFNRDDYFLSSDSVNSSEYTPVYERTAELNEYVC